jgi:hypothetical protein
MKKLLNKGDVIRTNPRDGFWGIAVVLSEQDNIENPEPKCHIAITPSIFRHPVNFDEIVINELNVLEFVRGVRLNPNEELTRKDTLIGVYLRQAIDPIDIIGSIDPSSLYDGPLPFEPWHYLEIKWPLCGRPKKNLGYEAVISWRRLNDSENLQKEIEESDRRFDEITLKIKEEEREKRRIAKLKKAT